MAKKSAKKAKSQPNAAAKAKKAPKKASKKAKKKGAAATKSTPAPPKVKASTITDSERKAALSYFKKFKDSPASEREHAEKVLEKYRDEILAKRGVKGVDVGIKVSGGYQSQLYAICIYVDQKTKDSSTLKVTIPRGFRVLEGQVVPDYYTKADLIPSHYDHVPTDVIGGMFRNAAYRPGGGDWAFTLSIDQRPVNPGTVGIGVLVKTPKGAERFLTCAHVLSSSPLNAQPTFTGSVEVYSRFSPDGPHEKIGTLVNAVPSPRKSLDWAYDAVVDCAIITPEEPRKFIGIPVRSFEDQLQPISEQLPRASDEAKGVEVWIRGAASAERKFGTIRNIKADTPLADGTKCVQQILIKANGSDGFARSGDSGALVSIKSSAIGILRAATDDGMSAIVSPLRTTDKRGIFDVLGLSFPNRLEP